MSDIADIDGPEIDNRLHQKIDHLRQKVRRAGLSSSFCTVCGEEIPSARQQAVPGCRLCLDCQSEREKHGNQ